MSIFFKIFFCFMIIAFSGSSNAALVTTNGTHVSFTYDDSLANLLELPKILGDTIFFLPKEFSASTENPVGGNLGNKVFTVTIDALNSMTLSSLALFESGYYIRDGEKAQVAVTGILSAKDTKIPTTIFSSNISSPSSFTETEFSGPVGNWTANANLNVNENTSLMTSIEGILKAKIMRNNFGDETAFIKETNMSLTAFISPPFIKEDDPVSSVPLPQAVWFFGAGLLGLLNFSKRKKLL